MNELMKFDFNGKQCRTVEVDNHPWWVGKDVCLILGYKDVHNALKLHCNGVAKYHPIIDTLGRTQNIRVINEPDLYRLISGSKLPAAQRFEKWIYEEIIPQIRRTGSYGLTTPVINPEAIELINKSSVVINRLMSEMRHLRLQNSLYKKNRRVVRTACKEKHASYKRRAGKSIGNGGNPLNPSHCT